MPVLFCALTQLHSNGPPLILQCGGQVSMMDPTPGTVGAGSIPAGITWRSPNPHTVSAAHFQ